ncbi:type I secretion C-terminal target domain-containing protein [Diaphorobacter sp.]|uniref:type I secretion C-terminal target domain-containing protein n=1 Tax=Diaphorobacter sp. TaxID=1934310 RepID=UPI0028AD6DA5|nr:type I secretion C-terminal target domain-containing protein [Diaphorobacter sp.]
MVINAQNTLDTTPIITGYVGFEIQPGEYVEVTVNGRTYNSKTGDVVVDPLNSTWYVQIPDEHALAIGTHDVQAVLKAENGTIITRDATNNELIVSPTPEVTVGAGGSDSNQKATAFTIGEDGMWRIHSNQAMLDANGTNSASLGSFAVTKLVSNTDAANYVQNATFVDFNRDGFMDLFSEDSYYANGQQAFIYNGASYEAKQVAGTQGKANAWCWYGGVIAFDKSGDGFVDLAYGDQTPNDANTPGGFDSQIVLNPNGNFDDFVKDGGYVDTATPGSTNNGNTTFDMELSGVDLNNDGTVDIVYHATAGTTKIGGPGANTQPSTDPYRLVVASNQGDGTWKNTQIIDQVFQRWDDDPYISNGVSMTWADFNGDGYMDLFLGRGYGTTPGAQSESRIHFNDGHGHLGSTKPEGIGNAAGTHTLGDGLLGGASLAIDWNGDGKMDIIELPGMGYTGGMTAAGNTGPVNLYTNTSSGGSISFATSNLLGGNNTIGSWTGGDSVTGGVAVDIDWDGDRDLLIFTVKGNTKYIENTTKVEDGTALHFRIFDKNGINVFYGNTVQLIDDETGQVVGTQIINPQSGNQTNDSSALVDFYGLDPAKTYSLVLLTHVNGTSQDVGGVHAVGANTIEHYSDAWHGFQPGAANAAYILTAEGSDSSANANIGNGIVGTGYNDTFFATLGTDIYNGAGGTVEVSGVKSWSNTGGLDIVDYKLAGNTAISVDLSYEGAQNTGFGIHTFKNIEGIAGSSGNDTFTDDAGNNFFEGRGGNDTFNLIHGGNDTLMYKLLNAADSTGGNGQDVVNGFTVGTWEATANADRIDLADLLVGYTPTVNGKYAAKYVNGIATIEAGDRITSYLKVEVSGGNTLVEIDRSGTGQNFTTLVTLNDVQTDLATLLANHQITLI